MCNGGPVQIGNKNICCREKQAGTRAKQATLPAPCHCPRAVPTEQWRKMCYTHPWTTPTAKPQSPQMCQFLLNLKSTNSLTWLGTEPDLGKGSVFLIRKIRVYVNSIFREENTPGNAMVWECLHPSWSASASPPTTLLSGLVADMTINTSSSADAACRRKFTVPTANSLQIKANALCKLFVPVPKAAVAASVRAQPAGSHLYPNRNLKDCL